MVVLINRLVWTSVLLLHPIFNYKTLCYSTRIFQLKSFPTTSTINSTFVSNDTKSLLFNIASLASVQNSTQLMEQIDTFYIPLFENLFQKCQIYRNKVPEKKTIYIGISAPQGCGKTTLTEYMKIMFERSGWSCLTISIDDFYLTHAEQNEVATSRKSNPLLQFRGNAGTHDVRLLLSTLKGAAGVKKGEQMYVPQYDKSLHSGRGDRAPFGRWLTTTGPVDVVILEGWMLGFTPLSLPLSLSLTDVSPMGSTLAGRIKKASIKSINEMAGMEEINQYLHLYQSVHELMDIWTVLSIEEDSNNHACHTTDPSSSCKDGPIIGNNVKDRVYKWRAQAEDAMRSQGKPAMTPAEVQDFVARFMPAYFTYLPWLYQFGPERRLGSGVGKVDNIPVVKVIVDELRSASSVYELE